MDTNRLPRYDVSDNPTHCCPRFNSQGWDEQELHFKAKRFVQVQTRSLFHFPLNMDSVFKKTLAVIDQAKARDSEQFIVLSYDPSAWTAIHYFAVDRDVAGQKMVKLSGDYLTKVYEGPFSDISNWVRHMASLVRSRGMRVRRSYFFYTTCPKCAKYYGKNPVVAVAEVSPLGHSNT
ncbi:hydrolase [Reinekea sp.]|uniref:hydrolase n=1 Tax=Reinekea sp. TaxID=1970455 RepID=UPI002A7FFCA6|nr:hydrolase [Reinekea sp.]